MSTLRIIRKNRVFMSFTSYRLFLDEKFTGKLYRHNGLEVEISPGKHQIQVRFGSFLVSNAVLFNIEPEETKVFTVESLQASCTCTKLNLEETPLD